MYRQIRDDETAFSASPGFGLVQRFFMLLLGGMLSGFLLKTFAKTAGKENAKMTRLKSGAVSGDPESQLRLGIMYAVGAEGRADYHSALLWLRKAAEQGEPNAQMLTALMCLEGLGVRRNYMQAARWARLSALHGNIVSQLLMGAFLEDGAGVRRDLERAVYWYRQAAAHPVEIGARQRLGTLYLEGKGVPKDTEEGLKWLNESAEMGDANACFQLGMIYYDGRLVEQDYEKALNWYLQAAEDKTAEKGMGNNDILFGEAALPGEAYTRTVGQMMKRNPGVTRDAWFYVGLMYETGRGTEQDIAQSRSWYQKAADAGDDIARQRLVFLRSL